jgi:hypothetical protein
MYIKKALNTPKLQFFNFRIDIDLKIIASIKAKDAVEARELIELMSMDEILKHEINDVSTIEISNWN